MLERPPYESGRDWYGLGLDVQDWGNTWGHTGAMEGTCGTVQRHHSGLSWAFLLNAWAADMDLDGVVKLALSSVGHLSPFPRGVARTCGEILCLTTRDESQCIMVNVPPQKVWQEIEEKKLFRFGLTWVGVNAADRKRGQDVTFNIVFSKDVESKERKVLLDVDVNQLQTVLPKCSKEGFQPECITTYTRNNMILGMVLLSPSDTRCVQEVDICVPAKEYVHLLRRRRNCGFHVLSQCVLQWKSDLLVTAIMAGGVGPCKISSQTKTEDDGQAGIDGVKQCANGWMSRKRKPSPPLTQDEDSSSGSLLPPRAEECPQAKLLTESPTEENVPHCTAQSEVQVHSSMQHEHAHKAASLPTKTTGKPSRKSRVKHRTLSWVQMTVDSFLAELGRQARHCAGLRNVHFYPADGDWFVSGVWSPRGKHNCYHRMGVSHLGLLPALAEAAARNVRLRFLCPYQEDGTQYYALFWDAPQET